MEARLDRGEGQGFRPRGKGWKFNSFDTHEEMGFGKHVSRMALLDYESYMELDLYGLPMKYRFRKTHSIHQLSEAINEIRH